MPAEVPVEPIPVVQSTYYASAGPMAPASGLQGALSGPWMVESQDMQIEYTRVPKGYLLYQITTLSSVSATEYRHIGTTLDCIITANYSKIKSYDTYSTSTYQQPQKFKIYALSADETGTTYGDLNASTLGPAGTIVSYQPYLSRREWNDSLDSETTSSIMVANFAYTILEGTDDARALDQTDPDARVFNYNFIKPTTKGTPLNSGEPYSRGWGGAQIFYTILGPYTVQKETKAQMIAFIDAIGYSMTSETLIKIPGTLINNKTWGDSGMSIYSKFRHDYN